MVEPYITAIFAGLLVFTLIVLATEKVHKTLVTLLAAGLSIGLGILFGVLHPAAGGHGQAPFYISLIDWTIVGIILGVTIFVEIASRSGVFTWFSIKLLKLSKGDPFKLLVYFSILTVLFSAFLDNITAMIVIGSLTVVACRKLNLPLLPYLVTEGILTNVGGTLTLVSSIPNIILGSEAGFSYLYFVTVALPYGIIAIIVTVLMASWLFKIKPIKNAEEKQRNLETVMQFDEWETVQDKILYWASWFILAFVIIGFALHDKIPIFNQLGLEFIPLFAAGIMLIFERKHIEHTLAKLEWGLIFFFIGLFVLIGVIDEAGVLLAIGSFVERILGLGPDIGNLSLMWGTAAVSSLTDNIPLSAMLAKILSEVGVTTATWWATIFGANLGGNLTPIGSASTVIAFTIMHKEKVKITFFGFVKFGALFTVVQLLLASAYLLIRF